MTFRVKRVYEPASPEDGFRILVDRLWPRGISRSSAKIDHWLREIAPSPELRKSFCHDPLHWEAFRRGYFEELRNNPEAVAKVAQWTGQGTVTLLFAARDETYNNAAALKEFLDQLPGQPFAQARQGT